MGEAECAALRYEGESDEDVGFFLSIFYEPRLTKPQRCNSSLQRHKERRPKRPPPLLRLATRTSPRIQMHNLASRPRNRRRRSSIQTHPNRAIRLPRRRRRKIQPHARRSRRSPPERMARPRHRRYRLHRYRQTTQRDFRAATSVVGRFCIERDGRFC